MPLITNAHNASKVHQRLDLFLHDLSRIFDAGVAAMAPHTAIVDRRVQLEDVPHGAPADQCAQPEIHDRVELLCAPGIRGSQVERLQRRRVGKQRECRMRVAFETARVGQRLQLELLEQFPVPVPDGREEEVQILLVRESELLLVQDASSFGVDLAVRPQ